ncbi:MAG: heme-degrading domain-containing protein [Cereibacter sphaeroides]|uniref:Heme-degrading domain-containing protein n=1 Tax=Cereibacter sphaeroides TaxID=1063 RepID=A0A2W5S9C3_CERSP|nr:MAG: heme-degrading domain-containing protein [Cereibacter sphaeroides]
MDEARIIADFDRLILPHFTEDDALALGAILVRLAREGDHPVVIDIRTSDRTLFHAALPGSAPLNDLWARRKSNTALLFQLPSLLVGLRNRVKGRTLAHDGLDHGQYADHGGAVPIRISGAGVVACATVSGLPEVEDHLLVIAGIDAMLTR